MFGDSQMITKNRLWDRARVRAVPFGVLVAVPEQSPKAPAPPPRWTCPHFARKPSKNFDFVFLKAKLSLVASRDNQSYISIEQPSENCSLAGLCQVQ